MYPGDTPPSFLTDPRPASTMPPDTSAPPATLDSNDDIARQIRTALKQEQRLRQDSIAVVVTDGRVTLDGEVSNHDDRYLAIRIAYDHSGTRTVVDNLQLRTER
jgi:osmotically-inducible protein OsmY